MEIVNENIEIYYFKEIQIYNIGKTTLVSKGSFTLSIWYTNKLPSRKIVPNTHIPIPTSHTN